MFNSVPGRYCGPAGLFPNNYMKTNIMGGNYNTSLYSPSLFANNYSGGFRALNNSGFGNYGCSQHSCNNSSSTPSWMNWMMGLSMGFGFLGNIFSSIWGNQSTNNTTTTTTGSENTAFKNATEDAKALNEQFANANVTALADGRFMVKINGEVKIFNNRDEVLNALNQTTSSQPAASVPSQPGAVGQPSLTEDEKRQKYEAAKNGLPEDFDCFIYNDLSEPRQAMVENGMDISEIIDKFVLEDTPETRQRLLDLNPDAIRDGKVIDVNKLTVFYHKGTLPEVVVVATRQAPSTLQSMERFKQNFPNDYRVVDGKYEVYFGNEWHQTGLAAS